MKRLWRLARWLPVALLALAALAVLPMREVRGDEMAPTLAVGERVWVLPLPVLRGDIVSLDDPLDPGRVVLRRVVAEAGQKIRYEEGNIFIDGKRIRQQEMGHDEHYQFLKENIWSKPPARATAWLIRRRAENVRWEATEPYKIPEGMWFVMADDRDGALDSRWWGPVPDGAIHGVVRLRVGQEDEWRPQVQFMKPIP